MIAHDLGITHALKPPLTAEVRQRADVIHMAVADGQILAAEHRPRARANVKAQIKLRNLNARRLARDGLAINAVRRTKQKSG
jgi:predicted GNAT family acetyltransferase